MFNWSTSTAQLVCPAIITLLAGNWSAAHATNLSAVGSLMCTTTDRPGNSAVDARLSCQFQGLSGGDGALTGRLTRKGPAHLPLGKRVFMWTVLSDQREVAARGIAGRYKGFTGGRHRGRLVGGRNGSIVLRPLSSQIGDRPMPTLLELRLAPVRALVG